MLLATHRIPILVMGTIVLFTLVLALTVQQAFAGDSTGKIADVSDFEKDKAMASGTEWTWTGEGDQLKVAVYLGSTLTNIAEIEIFVGTDVTTGTAASFSQRPTSGTTFPTLTNFAFIGTVPGLTAAIDNATTKVGIHLVDSADVDVVRSAAKTASPSLADISAPATSSSSTATKVYAPAAPTATPLPTPIPPPAGGMAPGSGIPFALILVGLALLACSGVYLARPHNTKA
jgi:hypothetical protein